MTDAPVTVYPAKSITTMNPMAPTAEVVAVAGDKIAAVGSREGVLGGLKYAGREYRIDDTFAGAALIPGLIEAHSHITTTGSFYQMPAYLGAYPRLGPNGMLTPVESKQAALETLRTVAATVEGPVTGWGYDPVLIEGSPKLTAADLDGIDATRPVAVMNMSGHVLYCNSVTLKLAGYTDSTDAPGVIRGADGKLTGELDELPAIIPAVIHLLKLDANYVLNGVALTAELAHQRGLTTISDLLTQSPQEIQAMAGYARSSAAKTRMACYYSYLSLAPMGVDKALPFLAEQCAGNDDRFRVAGVKFVSDGSIQNFTADLLAPPYYNGAPNGLFNFATQDVSALMKPYHDAGYQIATHTNADGASDKVLAALTHIMDIAPRRDNRHRMEHVQMLTAEQIATMASYGICANVFSKHIKYWGDVHRTMTLGPDRAAQMDAARTLIESGVHTSLHSDAWVTPIDQLESIVCATTRTTHSGFVLGPEQCITVEQALRAVTIEAAYLLREDRIKGSLEPGKLADITVLDRPLVTPQDAADAQPLATLLGGQVLPISPNTP
ncbi:MAG: amidohydrolase [Actinomycetes bacterium]